ncbi:MAG: hypothetical protein JWM91_3277 [Rhodospirillales bacterium]|nr:hypothetical protein [Rhodospirillales bacterium]
MTAQTQPNDQELARARTIRTLAIVLAVAAMAVLVYGFGMGWKPWYQVPAGLAAWASIEWQRQLGKKIKALEEHNSTRP